MLYYTSGDILASETEVIVNPVNCVGVMGRGLALQFKCAYPDNFEAYRAACLRGEMSPGRIFVFETMRARNPRFIFNFPTKRRWRDQSRLDDIAAGLVGLAAEVKHKGVSSLAIPPIGCGFGGLSWNEVRPLIERTFDTKSDLSVLVFEPTDAGQDNVASIRSNTIRTAPSEDRSEP